MGMAYPANCCKCQGAGFIYYWEGGKDFCDCMYGKWRKDEMSVRCETLEARQLLKDFFESVTVTDIPNWQHILNDWKKIDKALEDAVQMLDGLEMVTNKDFKPVNTIVRRINQLGYKSNPNVCHTT